MSIKKKPSKRGIRGKVNDMDVIEYLKTEQRICGFYMEGCRECPLSSYNNGTGTGCGRFIKREPEKCIEIMKKWTEEHPPKTRQGEFLKMFPDAKLEDGVPVIAPCIIDSKAKKDDCEGLHTCPKCVREYWTTEIE